MKTDYPLTFESNFHPALWGGESWEISAHPAGPSIIANGELKGKALSEVMPDFPLLIKVIDAKTRLSVQVHPNEETRKVTGGDPKTEMWVMLEDGFIYAGLKPGVCAKDIEEAVKSGAFEDLMVRHDAKKGECFFIPGGLVHAIGDNAKIYEVQQSSDTTFRLYDWNRVGKDGRPRELHVEKSCQAIDYSLPAPEACDEIECPFFHFRKLTLTAQDTLCDNDSPMVVFDPVAMKSTLVPAGTVYRGDSAAELFVTTIPRP